MKASIVDKRSVIHQNLFLIFSILVVVTLPFSLRLNSWAIVLFTLNWIAEVQWKSKMQLVKKNQFALLMIIFFGYHILGLLYTENGKEGAFELEKRIGCLIFPVVFASSHWLSRDVVKKILTAFVISCTLAALICSANAVYYLTQGDPSYLYYHKLGSSINFNHAVYFSFYIAFTVFIILIFLANSWDALTNPFKIILVFTTLFLLVFLIFLSSKTIILSTIVLLIVFLLTQRRKKRRIKKFVFSLLGLCILALVLLNNAAIKNRFTEVLVDPYDQVNPLLLDDYQGYHFTGGTIRLAIWKTVLEIVNQNNAWLYGVGTGDTQDMLTDSYIKKHVYPGDEVLGAEGFLTYNAHNQFLQFYLSLGIIGVILFIYILYFLWKAAWVHKDYYLLSMLCLFTIFCITESVLCTQKGIVFFSFFSSIFINVLYLNTSAKDVE